MRCKNCGAKTKNTVDCSFCEENFYFGILSSGVSFTGRLGTELDNCWKLILFPQKETARREIHVLQSLWLWDSLSFVQAKCFSLSGILFYHLPLPDIIVKPWPQTLSPKPFCPKTKTKGPWADTKLLQATTTTTTHLKWWNSPTLILSLSVRST